MLGRDKNLSERQDFLVVRVRGSGPHRLDHYLGACLNWRSRTRIQALIQRGKVLVNGEPSKPARKVRRDDVIQMDLRFEGVEVPDYDRVPLDVIYEDPWIVAVSKPPGLLVHPVGTHIYDTLINYLHHRYRDAADEEGAPIRPRLCHRIDKDTTGLIVVGKDPFVHNQLRDQFETRKLAKEYHALVVGSYPDDGSIEIPIGEGRDLRSSLDHRTLKASRTGIRVLRRLPGYTLLSCKPKTGRQNQIRLHLAAVGYPIVGDERLGASRAPPEFPQRYLLHSRWLRFYHPRLKAWVELTAPLPADFEAVLGRLEPGGRGL